jgi:hypothetical protein
MAAWAGSIYTDGDFVYDDVAHSYSYKGRTVPGVSTILTPIVDFGDAPIPVIKKAAVRGKAVHKVCELHDLDDLDVSSVDPRLDPFYQGYLSYLQQWEPEWTVIERPEYSVEHGFAGTPDRRGILRKRREHGKLVRCEAYRALVDLKATYALNRHVGVQLTGYDILDPEGPADVLYSLRLVRDGTYALHEHKLELPTFMSCLTLYNWRTKHGLTYPKW